MGKHHLAVLEWVKTAPTVNVSADWIMFSISTDRAIVEKHTLCELSDYYLVDLAEGLVHHPQGADRGLLTVAVQHAVSHSHHISSSLISWLMPTIRIWSIFTMCLQRGMCRFSPRTRLLVVAISPLPGAVRFEHSGIMEDTANTISPALWLEFSVSLLEADFS
jgi:hypothetical protein